MNPAFDAPQRSTAANAAPATAILADARHAKCVRIIFEQKFEHLCILALKYLNRSEVFAEDIVADVFEDALTKWPTARFDTIKDLEAYLCKCVINKSRNARKRNSRLIHLHEFPIDKFSIPNPMAKYDLDMDVLAKMLPTKQSEAFTLYCKGYSHEEIAQMMQLSSEGASKNLIYYARKKLQAIVNEGTDFDPEDRDPSNTSRKQTAKTNRAQTRPIANGPGCTPRIKDLANYLNGKIIKASVRKAILHWLMEDNYALDIITGLKNELKHNNTSNIETQLRKSKDSIRERLFRVQFLNNTGPHAIGNFLISRAPIYPRLISSEKKPLYELLQSGKFNWGNFPEQRGADLNGYYFRNDWNKIENTFSNGISLSDPTVWIVFSLVPMK